MVTLLRYLVIKSLSSSLPTYIGVLVLHKLEKGDHIRAAKVIDRLQPGEHAPLGDALKVIFTDVL